ncbi:MAG: family 10 glycosylhydrolase [Pirellulales bacterium]|nr:family 10 glycosylhydrolase [Pirellulales bacterium]
MNGSVTRGMSLIVGILFLFNASASGDEPRARSDDSTERPATFSHTVEVELGEDLGQNLGSLFEAVDAEGRVYAGAGFPAAYNTQDRSDRRLLQFFLRCEEPEPAKLELLPRPTSDAGTYLFGFRGRLYSIGRGGNDGRLRVWNPVTAAWQSDDATVPFSSEVSDGVLTVHERHVTFKDRTILALDEQEGRLGEYYYAGGILLLRRFAATAEPPENELIAYRWRHDDAVPIRSETGIHLELRTPGEFIYAFGQHGADRVDLVAVSNIGGVYVFDGNVWKTLREPNGQSYQVYSTIDHGDDLLLGHYPTGELLAYRRDSLELLAGQPPVMAGVSRHAREAQTMAIYSGALHVGVWPWGEVWRLEDRAAPWHFVGRMFTHPAPTDQTTHPYEEETKRLDSVLNRWGQRVTSMVPLGDSLYISTSAKGPNPYEEKFTFLADGKWKEYGAVYRYRRPGNLAVPFLWKQGPTKFRFDFDGRRLAVYQDDELLGETPCEAKPVAFAEPRTICNQRGVFGPGRGKLQVRGDAKVEDTRATQPFVAAYLDMSRTFDRQSAPAEREAAIEKTLDDFRSPLHVVMPYANTSSWSANYLSEIVARHTFGQWDPLHLFVQGAHQRRLSVWPVVCVCSSGHFEPQGILLDHPDWAIRDPEGKPLGFISPAHPAARRWIVAAVSEIVRKYQPDGLMLDYLRYFNRPWQLDVAGQAALEQFLAVQQPADEADARRLAQQFKEDQLTLLMQEIHEAARAIRPNLQLGVYSWGPHVAQDHLVAQPWPTWIERGYVDLVDISGYCYPANYRERYLEVFSERLRRALELRDASGGTARITFALGIKTSHGAIDSVAEMEKYFVRAKQAGIEGVSLFNWGAAQPFLPELLASPGLAQLSQGLPK